MSLRAAYEDFLKAPNPLVLSENIFLCYTTSAKSFSKPEPVIRHLVDQNKNFVKKKSEITIDAVEGQNGLALVVETTVEFVSGGGAYLPGLENFVTDKIATFPITHFVRFDTERKITQIRLTWDQASLLKHVEVIGSRGNNWPIVDGREQCTLLSSRATVSSSTSTVLTSSRGRDASDVGQSERSVSPGKRHVKDPYSSLDLFDPTKNVEVRTESVPNAVSPRASARPPPREMSELFAAGHEDFESSTENGGSPKKVISSRVVAPKGAGGKKFAASRVFEDDPDEKSPAPYKSDPRKYNHFSIGDELENDPFQRKTHTEQPATDAPLRAKNTKKLSQWDIGDFQTPEKVSHKSRSSDAVHFSLADDQGNPGKAGVPTKPGRHLAAHFEFQDAGTPISRATVHQPRPDQDVHFEFKDDRSPAHARVVGPGKGTTATKNMGLYTNNIDHDEEEVEPSKVPLTSITNNAGRKKGFDSHWSMADTPPASERNNENEPLGEDRKKAIKTMESQWDSHDQSPEQAKKLPAGKGRKGTESHWSLGDEAEATPNAKAPKPQAPKSFWDF